MKTGSCLQTGDRDIDMTKGSLPEKPWLFDGVSIHTTTDMWREWWCMPDGTLVNDREAKAGPKKREDEEAHVVV